MMTVHAGDGRSRRGVRAASPSGPELSVAEVYIMLSVHFKNARGSQ